MSALLQTMSFALFIYLAGMVKPIIGISMATLMLVAAFALFTYIDGQPTRPASRLKMSVAVVVATLLLVLLPTPDTMYKMAAAHYVQKVVEAPGTAELSDKLYRILNQELDKQLGKDTK